MSNKNSTQRIQEMYERVSGLKEAVGTKTPEPEDPEDSEGEQGKAQGKAQSTTDAQSRWRNAVWNAVFISFGIVLFFAALAQWLLPSLLPVNPAPEVFRDALKSGGEGPQMVVLPTGSFRMGSLYGEEGRRDNEGPVRTVSISKRIAMGRYEVTVGEFRRFVTASGYRTEAERNAGGEEGCYTREFMDSDRDGWDWTPGRSWSNQEYTVEEDQPVVCVSRNDARRYIEWLNEETEGGYRLPSESEWEYAVRAGSVSRYHFGDDESELCRYGNVADTTELPNGQVWDNQANCSDGAVYPTAVGSYRPNAFGLFDMHGNVWEWVADCWHDNYEGAPTDGSAWMSGCVSNSAVLRGGAWATSLRYLRAAARDWFRPSSRDSDRGFRLVQDLNPSTSPPGVEAPGSLMLELAPSDARVILPDIESGYRPGMALPAGEHQVIVHQAGYEEFVGTVRIESGVRTTRSIVLRREAPARAVGEVFRDALKGSGEGPEMVVLPTGSFQMGSPSTETGRWSAEGPVRTVSIAHPIAMGRYEVTFADYDRFITATGGARPDDEGWGRGRRPVINVSQEDAKAYATWLSVQTGKRYRLPSESEWEYGARAGTRTRYSWGDDIICSQARYGRGEGGECSNIFYGTSPVGSFEPNEFGLYDMHGNVWEWVEDCLHGNYEGAPSDGSAWTSGCDSDWRVVRGGAWYNNLRVLRAATRDGIMPSSRSFILGFRLVQDLNP